MNVDLTVQLTQKNISLTLPSGRVLTLQIASLSHGTRYLMEGAPTGSHDLAVEADITTPERLLAHWNSYVTVARTAPEEVLAAAQKRHSLVAANRQAQLADILSGPRKACLRGPGGLLLSLDAAEVFPTDPGEGCPAMVTVPFKGSGTYWCVADVGEVSTNEGMHELSQVQQTWLQSEYVEEAVNGFISVWTKRIEANPTSRPTRKH